MRMYDVDKLDYIHVLKKNKKELAFLNESKELYIDITNNTIQSDRNPRIYKVGNTEKICSFVELLLNYDLWLLLLDSSGKMNKKVSEMRASQLLSTYKRISSLNNVDNKEIFGLSKQVATICSNSVKQRKNKVFKELLTGYIFLEIVMNGLGKNKLIIKKENSFIDYKILRIANYLELSINLNKIPDFRICYNKQSIEYYNDKNELVHVINLSDQEDVKTYQKKIDKVQK